MAQNNKIKVGITQGDINGIGYEVILKTLSDPRITEICTPVVYGSSKVLAYHRKALNFPPLNFNIAADALSVLPSRLNIINCMDEEVRVELSKPTPQGGEAAYLALEAQSLMILMCGDLRVALVTGHIPLAEVPKKVTKELILEKLQIFNTCLKQDFQIIKPRIAVLSMNPHAGDNDLLGTEESDTIIPALKEAENAGILCFGPYAADGFFGSDHYKKFDGVLAMYHDQGLAPFKAIAMENGVNFTAGLPIVRTSPDHGTAYDITGQNIASESSFRQALYTAIDIYCNRKIYAEISANPLKKQYFDKSGDKEVLDLQSESKED